MTSGEAAGSVAGEEEVGHGCLSAEAPTTVLTVLQHAITPPKLFYDRCCARPGPGPCADCLTSIQKRRRSFGKAAFISLILDRIDHYDIQQRGITTRRIPSASGVRICICASPEIDSMSVQFPVPAPHKSAFVRPARQRATAKPQLPSFNIVIHIHVLLISGR